MPLDAPVTVLLVRSTKLPRTQREGLAAHGVEVHHMDPQELADALRGEGAGGGVGQRRDAVLQRVSEAGVCILDEGIGLRIGTLALGIRQESGGATFTTLDSLQEVAHGMALREGIHGDPQVRCAFLPKGELLDTLRGLGVPQQIPLIADASHEAPIIRPPRPMPYIADPTAFSILDLQLMGRNGTLNYFDFAAGRAPLHALLAPGAQPLEAWSSKVLELLIRHLPTGDLHLLGSPEAVPYWRDYALDPQGARSDLDNLLWHAMARDAGRLTLAAMPEALRPARYAVMASWDGVVAEVRRRMPGELMSAEAYSRSADTSVQIVRSWDIIPWEDPLAPETDQRLFRPTLTTLRVARRYRSAAEVLLEGYARWGAQPYAGDAAATQLRRFVGESPPATANELEGWIRLLTTLPPGRMKHHISTAIVGWQRIDVALANALGELSDISRLNLHKSIACLTEHGERHEVYRTLTHGHRNSMWADSMMREQQQAAAREAEARVLKAAAPLNGR